MKGWRAYKELSTVHSSFGIAACRGHTLFMRNPVARGGESRERRRPESCGGKRGLGFSLVSRQLPLESRAHRTLSVPSLYNPLSCVASPRFVSSLDLKIGIKKYFRSAANLARDLNAPSRRCLYFLVQRGSFLGGKKAFSRVDMKYTYASRKS